LEDHTIMRKCSQEKKKSYTKLFVQCDYKFIRERVWDTLIINISINSGITGISPTCQLSMCLTKHLLCSRTGAK
jgi:hypothetical protein